MLFIKLSRGGANKKCSHDHRFIIPQYLSPQPKLRNTCHAAQNNKNVLTVSSAVESFPDVREKAASRVTPENEILPHHSQCGSVAVADGNQLNLLEMVAYTSFVILNLVSRTHLAMLVSVPMGQSRATFLLRWIQ
jgi:hypothetical protein